MDIAFADAKQKEKIKELFVQYGYCKIEKVFEDTDLYALRKEYEDLTNTIAEKWFSEGILSSSFAELSFENKLIAIIAETGDKIYDHLRIYFNPPQKTTLDSPINKGKAIYGLLTNPKLLDIVETILGPEIYLNPVNILRIKPPQSELRDHNNLHPGIGKTWWHQDAAIYNDDMSDLDMLTVWVPITDAFKEMGCLEVVPFSHAKDISVHCATNDIKGIPVNELGELRHCVDMRKGDIQIHHKFLQHSSLSNMSDRLRISFDLRFQKYEPNALVQKTGVLKALNVPGFLARSKNYPERVIKGWQEYQHLIESHRTLYTTFDWTLEEKNKHFSSDHHFCL